MNFLYVVLPLGLLAPLTIYVYILVKRIVTFAAPERSKKWIRSISLLLAVLVMLPNVRAWKMYTILTILLLTFALLTDIVYFAIKKIREHRGCQPSLTWKKIFTFLLIPVICTAVTVTAGYFNIKNIVETDYTVYSSKITSEAGYKIAMVSDLHMGIAMNDAELKAACKRIEATKPDMVVLCGDLVDENTSKSEMEQAVKDLGAIKSTYGTFYIYGNHDDQHYGFHKTFTTAQFERTMRDCNIQILKDRVCKLNGEFTIVGRLDKTYRDTHSSDRKSAAQMMSGVDKKSFVLLLDHQPIHLSQDNAAGYDLLLAGHTHAGQIWPAGKLTGLVQKDALNFGYKKAGHLQVIVSAGISGWGFPVRTEKHSEYVIINIKPISK